MTGQQTRGAINEALAEAFRNPQGDALWRRLLQPRTATDRGGDTPCVRNAPDVIEAQGNDFPHDDRLTA